MNEDDSLDPGQQLIALQAAEDPNKYYQEQIKTHRKSLKKKNQDGENLANAKNSDKETPVCRICLCEDQEEDNPLISPCKCSGSMRLIHH
jgi:hypothetical protein